MAEVKAFTATAKAKNDFQLTPIQQVETQNSSDPLATQGVVVSEDDKPSPEMVYVVPGKFTENGNHVAPTGKAYNPVEVDVGGGGSVQTATPKFTPASGGVSKGTTVVISCDTVGATIYYTTDGSTPTLDSPQYDGSPITINAATTIKAIALKVGLATSAVGTGNYTIVVPKVANPVFTPAAGEVLSGTEVVLTCATDGAEIHYTTDGSTPTASSPVYSTPFEITAQVTIKAVATKEDYDDSDVVTALYKVGQPTAAAPTFTPAAGSVVSGTIVVLATTTPGGVIHYTTNGSTPTASSPVYSTPIEVNAAMTIKALTVADGYKNSSVASANYTIKPQTLYSYSGVYNATEAADHMPEPITAEFIKGLVPEFATKRTCTGKALTDSEIHGDDDEGYTRYVYAYPKQFGELSTYQLIGSLEGDINNSFTHVEVQIDGVAYWVYYLTDSTDTDNTGIIYK